MKSSSRGKSGQESEESPTGLGRGADDERTLTGKNRGRTDLQDLRVYRAGSLSAFLSSLHAVRSIEHPDRRGRYPHALAASERPVRDQARPRPTDINAGSYAVPYFGCTKGGHDSRGMPRKKDGSSSRGRVTRGWRAQFFFCRIHVSFRQEKQPHSSRAVIWEGVK